jgi:polysaccharide export outer membrane protein
MKKVAAVLIVLGLTNPSFCLAIQDPTGQSTASAQDGADKAAGQDDTPGPAAAGHLSSPDDVIGPDDSINVACLESEEISKIWRIDSTGDVNLPLIGQVHAAGLTADQLGAELTEGLKRYIHEPHVTVYIAEFRSQPVTVTGAVHRPGVFQIEGPKTLLSVLTMAGGLDHPPGATVRVVRQISYGPIPLPGAGPDADGSHSVIDLPLKDVSSGSTPAANLLIRPNDVVAVSTDERMVYIIGEVQKPGRIELVNHDSISMMEALAAAQGLTKTAAASHSEIMHKNAEGLYERIGSVDLKKLARGEAKDRMLTAGDIVVVPSSNMKIYTQIAAFSAIATGFGFLTRF